MSEPSIPVSAIRSALAIEKLSERRVKRSLKTDADKDYFANSFFRHTDAGRDGLLVTLELLTGTKIRRRRHAKP